MWLMFWQKLDLVGQPLNFKSRFFNNLFLLFLVPFTEALTQMEVAQVQVEEDLQQYTRS
jgi:hypothetical protein